MIDYILNFIQSNPLLTCLALFWIYRIYQSQKPFPKVEGSKVKSISSMPEFEQALLEGKKEGKRVLCDFYATWCPPCKMAAPVYGGWSKEHTNVMFLKVNVDTASDVARHCEIKAMPTFKCYVDGKETDTCQGWNQGKVLQMVKGE
jgi:thioredoxin 1|eukprot:g440.t1